MDAICNKMITRPFKGRIIRSIIFIVLGTAIYHYARELGIFFISFASGVLLTTILYLERIKKNIKIASNVVPSATGPEDSITVTTEDGVTINAPGNYKKIYADESKEQFLLLVGSIFCKLPKNNNKPES